MKLRIIFIIILLSSNLIISQESMMTKEIDEKIEIYLDCEDCDYSFFRRNLNFVNFVRDPKLADIHILVTRQRTASSSTEYGINFIGSNQYSDIQFKLKTVSPQFESDIIRWERLLKTFEVGILPYLSSTKVIDNLNITYNDNIGNEDITTFDSWNYWVFRIGLSSRFDAEESQKEYSFRSSLNVDRITELSKFKSRISYDLNNESFTDENDLIEIKKVEAEFEADMIYSLSPRWSIGLLGDISKSSFLNLSFASNIGAAIEYNIYPWDKSDRKVFTIAYQLNSNYYKYDELTIFNKKDDWRASESLELSLILRQTWGEIENTLEGSHYFYDFSKNRLSLNSNFSINIIKGLSFYLHLNSELIHDQLYLPAGDATIEELLLQQRQLGTDYEISGNIGIRLTFGSIYNNIVNRRL